MAETERRVIILVGPTCVGKTETSILIAKALKTEIISSDSMQIYRHMDIGTEKPSKKQQKSVKHHMIDIAEPEESFSTGRFIEKAVQIIDSLHSKGKIPIVTGGTGLYIKAMTRGIFSGPSADWNLRESLKEKDTAILYKELEHLDPETAGVVMPSDKRRIIRALEVCMKSGSKMSLLKQSGTSALPYEFVKIALSRDRTELYPMIESRVDRMMDAGLLEEVKGLLARNPSRVTMQAIGYKEIAAHLRGEYAIEEAVRLIKRNTKRYAKRQFTWFRKEDALTWIDVTGVKNSMEIILRIATVLESHGISLPENI